MSSEQKNTYFKRGCTRTFKSLKLTSGKSDSHRYHSKLCQVKNKFLFSFVVFCKSYLRISCFRNIEKFKEFFKSEDVFIHINQVFKVTVVNGGCPSSYKESLKTTTTTSSHIHDHLHKKISLIQMFYKRVDT